MEPKKNPKANLEKSKALFFQAGMILALACALAAFEWSSPRAAGRELAGNGSEYVIYEAPPLTFPEQEKLALAPPQPEPERLDIVPNMDPLADDWTPIDNTDGRGQLFSIGNWVEPEEVPDPDPIPIDFLEEYPRFRGGDMNTFRGFVLEQVRYPQMAQEAGVQGTVYVTFIISEKGYLVNARILRSSGNDDLDAEALRVVNLSERWTAGKQLDRPVKVLCTIPVAFRLSR